MTPFLCAPSASQHVYFLPDANVAALFGGDMAAMQAAAVKEYWQDNVIDVRTERSERDGVSGWEITVRHW